MKEIMIMEMKSTWILLCGTVWWCWVEYIFFTSLRKPCQSSTEGLVSLLCIKYFTAQINDLLSWPL